MFVCNIKINGSKIFKYFLISTIVFLLILILYICHRLVFMSNKESSLLSKYNPDDYVSKITASNYTNVLKTVHDNLDSYIGCKFNFTGYIYRIPDLSNSQFILARDMIISSDFDYVVVGFLCNYDDAASFEDTSWVNIVGEITKGDYHGDMPIVEILEIEATDCPNEESVYPPNDMYILTSGLI